MGKKVCKLLLKYPEEKNISTLSLIIFLIFLIIFLGTFIYFLFGEELISGIAVMTYSNLLPMIFALLIAIQLHYILKAIVYDLTIRIVGKKYRSKTEKTVIHLLIASINLVLIMLFAFAIIQMRQIGAIK